MEPLDEKWVGPPEPRVLVCRKPGGCFYVSTVRGTCQSGSWVSVWNICALKPVSDKPCICICCSLLSRGKMQDGRKKRRKQNKTRQHNTKQTDKEKEMQAGQSSIPQGRVIVFFPEGAFLFSGKMAAMALRYILAQKPLQPFPHVSPQRLPLQTLPTLLMSTLPSLHWSPK